jgi:coenzyme F420-0:L-glutamate ligase/coenzyme F420-1:gamma-L-glutamate ligase
MFSLGTAEARADGLRLATRLDDPDVLAHTWPVASVAAIAGSPTPLSEDIARAIAGAVDSCPEIAFLSVDSGLSESHAVARLTVTLPAGSAAIIAARAGAAIHILRASLASAGYLTTWLRPDADSAADPDSATSAIALGTITLRPRPNP